MKSWRIIEPNKIEFVEREGQSPQPKQVKVKVTKASIAVSDMLIYQGRVKNVAYPVTPGRHAVGIVVETGEDVKHLTRGDRVVIDPYIICDECPSCRDVDDCENLLVAGVNGEGLIGDLVTVDMSRLKKLPEHISDGDALFVEQTAIADKVFDKLELGKGAHIVISGATAIGLIAAQAAIYYQMVPIVVDNRADRLKIAEKVGVYYTVDSSAVDVYKKIRALTGGRLADALIFCTTATQKLQNSLECVAKNGKVALAGFCGATPDLKADLSGAFERQLAIYSVNNGSKYLSGAINMLANKSISVNGFVSKEIGLGEVSDAMAELADNPERYFKIAVKF